MRRATLLAPVLLLALFYAGFVAYPVVMTLGRSLVVQGTFTTSLYASLFDPANHANAEAVGNSVLVSFLSVLFGGGIGLLLAFALTQIRFRFRAVFASLAVVPVALPPLVGVIAFLFVFGESGILPRLLQAATGIPATSVALDGMAAIVAVHVYSFNAYFYLFASAALRRIDGSQLEAAAGLGAGRWRIFRAVVLPELRPALLGASILTFLASMASFSAPLLFAGGRRFITLQIYTTKLNGDINLAAAQSLLLTAVSLAFFVVYQLMAREGESLRRSKGVAKAGTLHPGRVMRVALLVAACGIVALEMLPIAVILLISFAREGSWTYQLFPTAYSWENYLRLLGEAQVFQPIVNSLAMTGLALGAAALVGTGGAWLVTKGFARRFRLAADLFLMVPYAIPGTVLAISYILAFNRSTIFSGYQILVGTFWILPLAYAVRAYPLMMRSVTAAVDRLDDAVLEAASSLGAGPWRRFRTIVMPLILPGIIGGAVLTVITLIGEFVASVLLYTFDSRPIAVEILAQLRTYNFGPAAAYCVVLLALILAVVGGADWFQRRLAARGVAGGE